MMEEARKLDHLLLELRSATGRIKVDNLVSMHPSETAQKERKVLLKTLVTDNLAGCTNETVDDNSEVWISEEGQRFLAGGGYRKRKAPDKDREEKKPQDRLKQVLLYAIPLVFVVFLLLILFRVIG